jgi:hypothetical protein
MSTSISISLEGVAQILPGFSSFKFLEPFGYQGLMVYLDTKPNDLLDPDVLPVYGVDYFYDERVLIGYLPLELSSKIKPILNAGQVVDCNIIEVIKRGDLSQILDVNIQLTIWDLEETRARKEAFEKELAASSVGIYRQHQEKKKITKGMMIYAAIGILLISISINGLIIMPEQKPTADAPIYIIVAAIFSLIGIFCLIPLFERIREIRNQRQDNSRK